MSRRLVVQALYQLQINPLPWQDIQRQFTANPEAERIDKDYFSHLFAAIAVSREALDERLADFSEIPPGELDPVEHAILWLGLHELAAHPDLPYRVAISEGVLLAQKFGATDAHKFVNAVLDRAARQARPQEYGQPV